VRPFFFFKISVLKSAHPLLLHVLRALRPERCFVLTSFTQVRPHAYTLQACCVVRIHCGRHLISWGMCAVVSTTQHESNDDDPFLRRHLDEPRP